MMSIDHRCLAEDLIDVVRAAGAVEVRHYRAGVPVHTKADASPVTIADQEAEAILLEGLERVAPSVPVVAEEAVAAGIMPERSERFFLVDPLDGTKEFVAERGEFTVNVALVDRGRPVFGIVYAPVVGEIYVTLDNDAAYGGQLCATDTRATLDSCHLERLRTRAPDARALVALTSRSHANAATAQFLQRYGVSGYTAAGSSRKFCVIARGEADLYPRLGPTREWDTAAGHAILAAAGGSVTTLDGAALLYGKAEQGYLNPPFVAWGRGYIPPRQEP
jgi:3'(2'), 5'-bisphosphate nucleotidase